MKEAKFLFINLGAFIALLMLGVIIFDERPNEMLGFALWGGLIYAVVAYFPMLFINRLLSKLPFLKIKTALRFLLGMLSLLGLILLTSEIEKEQIIWGLFIAYTVAFLLAFLIYNPEKGISE